jgi:hypothetical protein
VSSRSLHPRYKNRSAANNPHIPLTGSGIRQPTTVVHPASRDMVGLTKTDSCCQEFVTFDEGDPEDPVNWSAREKQVIVAILGLLSFVS